MHNSKLERHMKSTAVVMTMQDGIKRDIAHKVRWYEAGAVLLFVVAGLINLPWLLLMNYVQDNLKYEEV